MEFAGDCVVRARVVDVDGEPMADQKVSLWLDPTERRPAARTDAEGQVQWDGVRCGSSGTLHAAGEDGSEASATVDHQSILDGHTMELVLDPGIWMAGVVVDPQGHPIANASLLSLSGPEPVQTDGEGRFRGRYTGQGGRDGDFWISVSAEGYAAVQEKLEPEVDPEQVRVVLRPVRLIRVRFVNDDAGERYQPSFMQCHGHRADALLTGSCFVRNRGEGLSCSCPEGAGTIEGSGLEEPFDADTTEVTIDLGANALVRGRVLVGGAPHEGYLLAERVSDRLDLSAVALELMHIAGIRVRVDEQGVFSTRSLGPGRWTLRPKLYAELPTMPVPAFEVPESGEVELGELELAGGGRIVGHLEGTSQALSVFREVVVAESAEDRAYVATVYAQENRSFSTDAVPPGRWMVFPRYAPEVAVAVEVTDGADSEDIGIALPDAVRLPGFGLAFALPDSLLAEDFELDALVVDSVEAGGLAEEAGIASGDRVTGISLPRMGADLEAGGPGSASLAVGVLSAIRTNPSLLVLELDGTGDPQVVRLALP